MIRNLFAVLAVSLVASPARPADSNEPPSVPVTRAALKQTLEDAKSGRPRLPVPAPTEADKARGVVNNGRMRSLLLPADLREGTGGREADPTMSLDFKFKTQLFWIVSRTNNCTYCLGHQEIKLTGAGATDDQIAALDSDWSPFTDAERSAFAVARKLTYEPHLIRAADLAALRKHYSEKECLEIIVTVAGNNATNRWTGGLAIPPEPDGTFMLRRGDETKGDYKTFLRPTSEKYKDARSKVAPLGEVGTNEKCVRAAEAKRPPLESRAEVEAALASARTRSALLPLTDEAAARKLLPEDWSKEPLPEWVRLLVTFPKQGVGKAISLRRAEEGGRLSKSLAALIAWTAARQDRAWYALGHSRRKLHTLGLNDDAVFAAEDGTGLKDREKAALAFASKLTARPYLITDADVAELRRHFEDSEVAEIVYRVGNAVYFNRVTEAVGLRLED